MNELKYRKGIVFFIDILGSQQRTQDSSKIQESYFIANTFITEMENVQKRHRITSIVDRAVFSFSDCAYIIYSLKQGYESEESEIKMIYQSLYNTQQTLCDFIYNGFLCRGGITFGDLYMDLSRNMVFGPAITKAFKLENQANDPNIIFDDELAQRIITFDEKIKKENDEAALLNGEIIKLNHNSKKYYLNYLNYFFNIGTAQLGSNSVSFEEFYTTVIDNIQKELKKISDPHIKTKLQWQLQYINEIHEYQKNSFIDSNEILNIYINKD